LVLGESSNGQDSGLQNRVWGFESLLPCQSFGVRKGRGNKERLASERDKIKGNRQHPFRK
jgi:hypothetical protein